MAQAIVGTIDYIDKDTLAEALDFFYIDEEWEDDAENTKDDDEDRIRSY